MKWYMDDASSCMSASDVPPDFRGRSTRFCPILCDILICQPDSILCMPLPLSLSTYIQNTQNNLLNLAFQTIKKENHQWLKNIEYYLWKIGYRNVWENPNEWNKTSFKLSMARRLKDMYIQRFHNFRTDDINHNKCVITNTCVRSICGEQGMTNQFQMWLPTRQPGSHT